MLLIARSARALAASARRAGYAVAAIDHFADSDTRTLTGFCRATPYLDRDHLQPLLSEWRRQAPAGALILPAAGIEADTGLLDWLQAQALVAANTPAVIERVKQPRQLARLLASLSLDHPSICLPDEDDLPSGGDWLVKRSAADGGGHVRAWTATLQLATNEYLQARVSGTPMSVVLLADGVDMRLIGTNRCLHAAGQSGRADDYRFAGAVSEPLPPTMRTAVEQALTALVRAIGLRGLCGIDMLVEETTGTFQIVDINPRPPATFELHEQDSGPSLVQAHIEACAGSFADSQVPDAWSQSQDSAGKLVVYIDTPITITAAPVWPDWVCDRPVVGQRLEADAPLCTIVARDATAQACSRRLEQRRTELLNNIKKNLQFTELNEETFV